MHKTSSKRRLRDGDGAALDTSTFAGRRLAASDESALLVLLLGELSPQQPQPCSPKHRDGSAALTQPCSSSPSQLRLAGANPRGCLVAMPRAGATQSSREPVAPSKTPPV